MTGVQTCALPIFRAGLGYHQPAGAFASCGIMGAGTGLTQSKYVARRETPVYIAENCTQCMECITACPDTALPNMAQDVATGRRPLAFVPRRTVRVRPPEEHEAKYYLRMTVQDRPGVLARIAAALGEAQISIASFIQYEVEDAPEGSAELVFTTHRANEGALTQAIREIERMDVVLEIGNVLPMAG